MLKEKLRFHEIANKDRAQKCYGSAKKEKTASVISVELFYCLYYVFAMQKSIIDEGRFSQQKFTCGKHFFWGKMHFCQNTISNVNAFIALLFYSVMAASAGQGDPKTAKSVYEFTVNDIKGNEVSLEKYRGHPLIIVNVASKCGYTAQHYKELNELYGMLNIFHQKTFRII